ncbi:ParB/RepB/Spo0J family partition protein [Arenibaculum pallidiluteum]|uniref:ParB/RepB/Spo0J family partition protein n=1 Tax=Arenibaculum pallidiluteum TaxID=2812559 RepID=UPI001A977AB0|nr:ParB/RepB/Spo0J family partition protein [Arenibaculum pallidiluteum]
MEENKRRPSLGRGLSALFGEAAEDVVESAGRPPRTVPIEFVHPGRFQPRKRFDQEAIQALVESVRERGILQPLLVRRHPESPSEYELIAGERRWRAAQIAGLHEVPVVLRELSDREALEIALIENIQRQDLTPLEEAEGYRRLMDEFAHTQENLAKALGKSRSHIANMLRLLSLPDPIKEMVGDGRLTAGHARALLGVPEPVAVARQVVEKGLNVRQVEQLAREAQATKADPVSAAGRAVARAAAQAKDPDTLALERELTERLGLKVTIGPQGPGGTVTIQYQNLDQLDEVIRRLSGGA